MFLPNALEDLPSLAMKADEREERIVVARAWPAA